MEEMNPEMTLEEAFDRLEAIAQELEAGKLDLIKAMSRYEEGIKIARFCEAQLNAISIKLEQVSGRQEAAETELPNAGKEE